METNYLRPKSFDPWMNWYPYANRVGWVVAFVVFGEIIIHKLYRIPSFWASHELRLYRDWIAIDQRDDRNLISSFLPIRILDLIIDSNVISKWRDHISPWLSRCAKISCTERCLPKNETKYFSIYPLIHNCKTIRHRLVQSIGTNRSPVKLVVVVLVVVTVGEASDSTSISIMIYRESNGKKSLQTILPNRTSDGLLFRHAADPFLKRNKSTNCGYLSFLNVFHALLFQINYLHFVSISRIEYAFCQSKSRVI